MSGGDQWTTGPWPGIEQWTPSPRRGFRTVVYARLEEISFRAGIAAATTLLVLVGVALAVAVTLLPGHTAPVTSAASKPAVIRVKASPASTAAAAASVPALPPSAHASAAASAPPRAAVVVTQPAAQSLAAPSVAGLASTANAHSARRFGTAGRTYGHGGSGGRWPGRPETGQRGTTQDPFGFIGGFPGLGLFGRPR